MCGHAYIYGGVFTDASLFGMRRHAEEISNANASPCDEEERESESEREM